MLIHEAGDGSNSSQLEPRALHRHIAGMARKTFEWPEGLSDAEAVERLESIMISACDGARELGRDRAYKAFRKRLLERDDLVDFIPMVVRTHNDLDSFVSSNADTPNREERRERVRNSFSAIRSTLQPSETQRITSAGWTGRPSKAQQAQLVKALAVPALQVVDSLLREHERVLDNGGPIDADQERSLRDLKELHAALGELIRLVDADRPIDSVLRQLTALRRRAIASFAANVRKDVAALHGTAATVAVGIATIGVTQLLTGNEVAAALLGTMAGGAFPKLRPNEVPKK